MRASFRVGRLLAWRQIQRSSIWTTSLVIFVMTLTFLNLVVVSGVLVGLMEGAAQGNREQYTGYVFMTPLPSKTDIEDTAEIIKTLETIPEVTGYSARSIAGATIEANYKERRNFNELPDTVAASIVGINPEFEDALTGISEGITSGEWLTSDDDGYIVLGYNLLEENLANFGNSDFIQGLGDIEPGDKVRVNVNGKQKEFTVKGFVNSKVGELSFRSFIIQREFNKITGRYDSAANEISIWADNPNQADILKEKLIRSGLQSSAAIETWEEAQGKFLDDIRNTFNILGSVISGIGLLVASITVFIIIFINAITRRKFIGILKGIGIKGAAIEISYVIQSVFYAVSGSLIGILLTYGVLVPFFEENPIDFPFSDGILVAPLDETLIRLAILILATIIAGFIPARIIIKKNTLDSILGR